MLKSTLIILCAAWILNPDEAMAKKYPVNDRSTGNTCKYVHDWFLHVKVKHAVFVTTGGVPYRADIGWVICQAGAGDTLAGAKSYAIKRCESTGKKFGIHRRCKVVKSR